MRPLHEPNIVVVGAELVLRFLEWNAELNARHDLLAGNESVFIGQIHSGEIYNQYPQECWLEGTRRWLPGTARETVEREFRAVVNEVCETNGVEAAVEFRFIRDAFTLEDSGLVSAFQRAFVELSGHELKTGPKPFVDDGNSFWALAGIPAITHGPKAGGQHTVNEWVSIDDLVRVARLYALTAVVYCLATKRLE
jgi:acetylornithine deacetylase/succinyl-diaminopimelate desuccinylase-like protein